MTPDGGTVARVRVHARRARRRGHVSNVGTSVERVLVFDTETTTDFRQRARVGGWIIKHLPSGTIEDVGFFHDVLTPAELDTARAFAAGFGNAVPRLLSTERDPERAAAAYRPLADAVARTGGRARFLSRAEFADMLLGHLRAGHAVAGHNLPFDLGAIATAWWTNWREEDGKGFHLALCECADVRRETVMTGSRRDMAETRISCSRHPAIVTTSIGGKKVRYSLADDAFSGPLLDTVVLGRALLGPGSLSLDKLGERFKCRVRKRDAGDDHGATLSVPYLEYLATDVLASVELLEAELANYARYGLTVSVTSIYSEASIGKAIYREVGVTSDVLGRDFTDASGVRLAWAAKQDAMRKARAAYCGARSEVRARLTPVPVACLDFKSQYPSVNALMDLRRWVIADRVSLHTGDAALAMARRVLDAATLEWLRKPSSWTYLPFIVEINPAGSVIPLRWEDSMTKDRTFGLASVTSGEPQWITMADAIASKLLTGRTPELRAALWLSPTSSIGTDPCRLLGHVSIDIGREDLFRKIIVERENVRAEMKRVAKADPDADALPEMEAIVLALKLLANSTAYGILGETVMREGVEEQGAYYAPHIVAHITAGGRLLLAMAEAKAAEIGERRWGAPISYAYCDTDGIGFIRPDVASVAAFDDAMREIADWFQALSPYGSDAIRFLEREEKGKHPGEMIFLGVSCKRYVIYRRTPDGRGLAEFVKVSSHGTGNHSFDGDPERYEADEAEDPDAAADDGPAWTGYVSDKRGTWRETLWGEAIARAEGWRKPHAREAALPGGFSPEPAWTRQVVRRQVAITTPHLLRLYRMVPTRPYAFFLHVAAAKDGDRDASYVAPFSTTEAGIIASGGLDVKTGKPISGAELQRRSKTLWGALRDYFSNREKKSDGPYEMVRLDGKPFLAQSPGMLARPMKTLAATRTIDRKGRVVSDLFSTSSEEDE